MSYFPSLLEPRRRAERALLAVVQEAYVLGVSTRRVEDLVEALGIASISRSEVSRISAALDAEVETFRSRVSSLISRSLRPTAGQIRSTNPLEWLQQGDQAPDRGGRDLPHPGESHPPGRDGPRRAGRRVAGRPAPLPSSLRQISISSP